MAETPMQGLADWLRSQIPPGHNGPYWSRHRRWASEVEAARASLPAPTDDWLTEAERLVEQLDGYLNSPQQVDLHDALLAHLRAHPDTALLKDAERYRWLRGHVGEMWAGNGFEWAAKHDVIDHPEDAKALDAAVDQALEKP